MTALQAVYGRGIAEFGQPDGRADSGKVVQYEPTKHMAQCVRVPLRNIVTMLPLSLNIQKALHRKAADQDVP